MVDFILQMIYLFQWFLRKFHTHSQTQTNRTHTQTQTHEGTVSTYTHTYSPLYMYVHNQKADAVLVLGNVSVHGH